MKVLITGASGFVGQYVVAAALQAGHQVRAVIRPKSNETRLPWHTHPNVEFARFDLRQRRGLADILPGVDAVIHLAATKGGDFYDRFAGTVIGTENLLLAMEEASINHLVVTSTFSLYDYKRIPRRTVLDEDSPLIEDPLERDAYAQTKLIQEEMIREWQQKTDATVTFIRPGMIYGREALWHALIGGSLGESRWLKIGSKSTLPMTYVENCSEAIVKALTAEKAFGKTINIVDDNLPTQQTYVDGLLKHETEPPKMIPVNWSLMQAIGNLAWFVNKGLLGGQARLPGILVPAQLQARFRPLQYSNRLAKELLDWSPRYSFEEALRRSYGSEDLLTVEPEAVPATSA
ncbi:NAD(P)-dependent oxidoreductase [Oscillatoria sp. CS-180]|uniref:NAD-dependent epimerase/dehydratase family protein n=1 Tax=Oscillatoria sp. CS-180 TaxID=3021720 RepID=UPI00232FCFDC|nr:NAD(P)-dependent oxidoreductase [Oscillatoria sp. CS-180]MDB9528198.1 NAD(P)-dependent oxidoreductase [Oscillatoria sp. CS-180]